MIRRTPLRRTGIKRKIKPHRDPVTVATYRAVRARDGGCLGARLSSTIAGPSGANLPVFPGPCFGPIELDHVHHSGFGRRGPSTVWNLVSLCSTHHRWKTDNGRVARIVLDAYLSVMKARAEAAQAADDGSTLSGPEPEQDEPDAR